ncbi:hypothetical protein C0J52_28074 [Blattella germanica]|nr:hypothetical protein C0J52_28074 [Blattella germanica]
MNRWQQTEWRSKAGDFTHTKGSLCIFASFTPKKVKNFKNGSERETNNKKHKTVYLVVTGMMSSLHTIYISTRESSSIRATFPFLTNAASFINNTSGHYGGSGNLFNVKPN